MHTACTPQRYLCLLQLGTCILVACWSSLGVILIKVTGQILMKQCQRASVKMGYRPVCNKLCIKLAGGRSFANQKHMTNSAHHVTDFLVLSYNGLGLAWFSCTFTQLWSSCNFQEIDGKSLMLLQREDIIRNMNLKLGPALKIYEKIKILQKSPLTKAKY